MTVAAWDEAAALRRRCWGRDVFLRGIVEFSSHCRQNCLYCGLRRDNASLARYRLEPEEIFGRARAVRDLGIGTVVLQSGEDPAYSGPVMADLIRRIKGDLGLAVTLSLGERARAEYALWRAAGADRYLLKAETFDATLYARLRPGKRLDRRLDAVKALADLGYETGSGIIAGLPGLSKEPADTLDKELDALAALRLDMVSISPFVPHPATPLGDQPAFGPAKTLAVMAAARLRMPTAHIPVTSALGLHGDAVRLKALEVADVLMPSLTPERVREEYAIYPGKNRQQATPEERAHAMRDMLAAAGFALPSGPGSAWRVSRGEASMSWRHAS
ncbi:Iron-only hydrogenase maturation protein HydE [uncultured delta proteobacterium]|uniref:Iron-only hydrogenase maturation protein HydE n=1 Tax=uncultured delta proteobacterium TaxID=34034 RepID=A0A212JB17_9DELT|nr:Iron-only hydrogenase maturation protein HydE [uncultured delta proteobacterium]